MTRSKRKPGYLFVVRKESLGWTSQGVHMPPGQLQLFLGTMDDARGEKAVCYVVGGALVVWDMGLFMTELVPIRRCLAEE
jgi:hypothetical protein